MAAIVASVLSGVITVTTAGTAVQGTETAGTAVAVKAHPDNSDTIWMGNNGSGTVAAASGFPLNPGEGVIVPGNLSQYWFDADVNGEKVCWLVVSR